MKKLITFHLSIVFVLFCISFSACSKDEGAESEKGTIEKMTDHAADVVVDKIRTPMEKARSVKDLEEKRMRGVDEALIDD
ncbi:MAG: hypothetical protein BA872_01380 [Desulfobacterales bacterium C00003060]|nr:MAG: hypothetical protein BA861_02755 [Desulfobacterales bacterium S3730MH5]OEU76821.1 MAG: hypothetical protein BA872_01380 [Desulfobacterales bacterium C00003060]OEU77821.1 MAG: hypothetical protein BA865_12620 [Desulfobacterales bacterium S5133MH4]